MRGVDDSQDTKSSDAGPDAAAATNPQAAVELIERVLDNTSRMEKPANAIKRWRASSKGPGTDEGVDKDEDEDDWERISNKTHRGAGEGTRSTVSRFFLRVIGMDSLD